MNDQRTEKKVKRQYLVAHVIYGNNGHISAGNSWMEREQKIDNKERYNEAIKSLADSLNCEPNKLVILSLQLMN